MTTIRRRVVRPAPTPPPAHAEKAGKVRQSLEGERTILNRWMAKLKRAFHAVEKSQARINRLERQLRILENQ